MGLYNVSIFKFMRAVLLRIIEALVRDTRDSHRQPCYKIRD